MHGEEKEREHIGAFDDSARGERMDGSREESGSVWKGEKENSAQLKVKNYMYFYV